MTLSVHPFAPAGRMKLPARESAGSCWRRFSCQCPQNFVTRDRQILHTAANGIEDGVANGRHGVNNPSLTDTFSPKGTISVVALDEDHLNLRRIEVGHDPCTVIAGGKRLPTAPVV